MQYSSIVAEYLSYSSKIILGRLSLEGAPHVANECALGPLLVGLNSLDNTSVSTILVLASAILRPVNFLITGISNPKILCPTK